MRNALAGLLLMLIGTLAAGNGHAQLYRWTDAEGRTHYSNVAPPANAKSIGGLPAAQPSAAPAPARAAAGEPVVTNPRAAAGEPVVTNPRATAAEPVVTNQPAPAPAPTPSAGGKQPRVVMYSTSWCPYCAQARAMFRARGIEFTEYDIEQSAQARAAHRELGGRGVPLILVGFEALRGFNEQRVLAAIDAQRGK